MNEKSKLIKNSNSKLADYLHFEIIKILINYLLIYDKKKTNEINYKYSLKKFSNYIDELITYSMVSNKWFNFISTTISNNIINYNLFENWFKLSISSLSSSSSLSSLSSSSSSSSSLPSSLSCLDQKIYFNFKKVLYKYKNNNSNYSIINIDIKLIYNYFNNDIIIIKANKASDKSLNSSSSIQRNLKNNKLIIIDLKYKDCVEKFLKLIVKDKKLLNIINYQQNQENENENGNENEKKQIQINIKKLTNFKFENKNKIINKNKNDDDEGCSGGGGGGGSNDDFCKINLNYLRIIEDRNCISIYNAIKCFNTKNLIYEPNDFRGTLVIDYSILFNPDTSGNIVESIIITKTDHIEPLYLKDLNKLLNLHTLSIPISFHEIQRNINNNNNNNNNNTSSNVNNCSFSLRCLKNKNNLINDWEIMINSIISSKSLKNLKFINFCFKMPICNTTTTNNNNNEIFYNGFKKLLSFGLIQYLKLEDFDFNEINKDVFSVLSNNKILKTLILKNKNNNNINNNNNGDEDLYYKNTIEYLISNIFTSENCSIKHFKFYKCYRYLTSSIFNSIINNQNELNLYSITFEVMDNNQFNQVLDKIKIILSSSCRVPIKEFNIKVQPHFILNFKEKVKQFYCCNSIDLESPKIIINIRKNKK
ncbi:hypothetical protein ACTFIW_001726 [Dictyostelium discoideum]